MEELVLPKRALGNGKWDRMLKKRMVELSVADNYEEAKHEWVATGRIWYIPFLGDYAERDNNYLNEFNAESNCTHHTGKCLCGHRIVWHFEIHNTENDNYEIVGSDHIESYLIIREISERTGLSEDEITDEMIEEWLDTRVKSLKAQWWWDRNGELFEDMFDTVKEIDLRFNVRETGTYYDYELAMNRPKTKIRKRGTGQFGDYDYKMASIVWRWNHPDNPKAQINTTGYPNDRLYQDLIIFYSQVQDFKDRMQKEDEFLEKRKEEIQNGREQTRRNQAIRLADSMREARNDDSFAEACEFYGIEPFSEDIGSNDWERKFLRDVRTRIIDGKNLSDKQMQVLQRILTPNNDPPTEKQLNFLVRLGYDGATPNTKTEASRLIDGIMKERRGE
jgi:hypothetical protein